MQNIAFEKMFAVLAVVFFLIAGAEASLAQTSQQERQVENKIPKHVPLEVKLTKEKEKNWKDLKNENWARDFEIEITNTGNKPIYAFGIHLDFDVLNEYQYDLTVDILYGRPEFSDPRSIATADDIPLKPGESKIFTIPSRTLLSWEKGRREKQYRLPTKVKITLVLLTFGDGTGLMGDRMGTIVPVPVIRRPTPQ